MAFFLICRCDCGTVKKIRKSKVINGKTKSCGCYRKSFRKTHGMSKTSLYNAYNHMKERCYCENNSRYKNYGGRGIKVCDEWLNSFDNFKNWAMANGYKEDLSIDRIDVNGNYEPSNCRWADKMVQANNTTRNIFTMFNGEKITVSDYCRINKIDYNKFYSKHYRKRRVKKNGERYE